MHHCKTLKSAVFRGLGSGTVYTVWATFMLSSFFKDSKILQFVFKKKGGGGGCGQNNPLIIMVFTVH